MYLSKSDIETIFDNIKLEDVIRIWENMYEKITEEIGKNNAIKSYVDLLINDEVYTKILNMIKDQTTVMYKYGINCLPLESIKHSIEAGRKVTEEQVSLAIVGNEYNLSKYLLKFSILLIDKCIRQTFVEKLAEFMNVNLNN